MTGSGVAAVIQARINSTRLPGKVLKSLAGRPLLWHVVTRLRKCRTIDTIAIATSTSPDDDPLQKFAAENGVELVRGPENNVLERYRIAADRLQPEVIVRVTGDSPLIDSRLIDRLVDRLAEAELDYSIWPASPSSVHEGIDPFRVTALQRMIAEAADDPIAREHVSAYFKQHPDKFSIGYLPIDSREHFPAARFSVDTPADLRFLSEIYRELGVAAGEVDVRDVVQLLKQRPDLLEINQHVHQKSASEITRRVLFRCDGDAELGFGHIVRSIALANQLREESGWGVTFLMERGPAGFAAARRAQFPVVEKPAGVASGSWLEAVARQTSPHAIVFDTRCALPRLVIRRLRHKGIKIVSVDDMREHRLDADLSVHPPVPQVQAANWDRFSGELRAGWEWVVLRREFSGGRSRAKRDVPTVLVTMGGSDPAGMTLAAVRALDQIVGAFHTKIVLGPGFQHEAALQQLLGRTRREFDLLRNVSEMAELMLEADLAVASFGVTAYELAAMGTPALFLCLTADHEMSAAVFVEHGMAESLGQFDTQSQHRLTVRIRELLETPAVLERMSHAARSQVDGRGASRIADWITAHCGSRAAA